MNRTVYLNGEYLPEDEARISIFDRAVLFGDAIYEVAGVLDGKLIDFEAHMQRYQRSLGELRIPVPLARRLPRRPRPRAGGWCPPGWGAAILHTLHSLFRELVLIKERTGSRQRALPLTALGFRPFQENDRPFPYRRVGGWEGS